MWNEIKDIWKTFGSKVSVAAKDVWSSLWGLILNLIVAIKDAVANFFKAAWKVISGLVAVIWSLLADALWGTLSIIWKYIWNKITGK